MTTSREDIKNWLKSTNTKRELLAEACGVSIHTVNGWLSNTDIPLKKLKIVETLMGKNNETSTPDYFAKSIFRKVDDVKSVAIVFTNEEYELILEAAQKEGVSVSQFIALSAIEDAEQISEAHPLFPEAPPAPAPSFVPTALALPPKYTVTVIGEIAAGALCDGDTVAFDVETDKPLGKDEYVLRVNGHSMEPLIADGALVVMRKYTTPPIPKVGTIVEYWDGPGVTLKELSTRKNEEGQNEYILKSVNPAFPDILPMDGGHISALYLRTLNPL